MKKEVSPIYFAARSASKPLFKIQNPKFVIAGSCKPELTAEEGPQGKWV